MAEMETEGPRATEVPVDDRRDANGERPQGTTLLTSNSRESCDDNTSGTDRELATMALLNSPPRESGHIESDANDELAQNKTNHSGSDPSRGTRPLEAGKSGHTSQMAFLAMLGFLLLGVLIAISHHLFYSYLNTRATATAVVGQTWAIRIGNSFSYLFKTALVAVISVVYAQSFWFIVRRTAFEIGTLDDLFTLLNNPLGFYNRPSLYGRASLLFALAIVSWLVPISALFAPGALTVTIAETISVTNKMIPVLAPMDNFFGIGVESPITSVVQALALGVLAGSQVVPWASPCGVNCSYTFSFAGPAYQCVELGPFSSTSINIHEFSDTLYGQTNGPLPTLDSSVFYCAIQYLGNETSPPGILILYEWLNNTLRCDLYNSTYTTAVSYLNNEQTVQNDIQHHNPIVNGLQLWNILVNSSSELSTNITFWERMNLILLESYATDLLAGYIVANGTEVDEVTTASDWTGLGQWNPGNGSLQSFLTFGDLETNVQDLVANYTISLIGANIDNSQLTNVTSTLIVNASVPATSTSCPVVYTYDAAMLWVSYACAIGITTICVIVGSGLLYSNGVAGSLTFAQVLVTTRNPTLDNISEGAELGGKYITNRVRKVKVKYGLLEAGQEKVGFGTKDEIRAIGSGVQLNYPEPL